MLRRRLAPEPFAASASASRACAAFGAVLALIAVLMGRSGAAEPRGTLAVLAFALVFASFAVALALWSAAVIWRTGRRGSGRALAGLALAGLVLAYPAFLAVARSLQPFDGDMSTDPAAPPPFSASPAALAARGGAAYGEPPAAARESARRASPGLGPVMLDMSGEEAFDLALRAVGGRGWRVVETAAPRGKFGTGHIDAVAPTRIMGLPEDVTIRIRPVDGQTRVDIRSASRFGNLAAGENAGRIQSLSDELQDAGS